MSLSFSANQYDDAFKSNKLCNWEVPAQHREHPRFMQGTTKIIANDRGHLQSGVPRSRNNPWGNFVGTWDIPKRIPGNKIDVSTARSTYAQEKLQREAEEARKILSGNMKNANRTLTREGKELTPRRSSESKQSLTRPESGPRSGAAAPGSKMFPYSPLASPPQSNRTPPKVQSPTSPRPATKDNVTVPVPNAKNTVTSPIPGVPDIAEVLAQETRKPTPKRQTPHEGLSAL